MPALLKTDAVQKKHLRQLFAEEISQVSGGLKGTTDPGPNQEPTCTYTILHTAHGDGDVDTCDPDS